MRGIYAGHAHVSDPIASLHLGHPRAHRNDDPGSLDTGDKRQRDRIGRTRPVLGVNEVDADGAVAYQGLPGAREWLRDLHEAQHLRPAERIHAHGLHLTPLSCVRQFTIDCDRHRCSST